MNNVNFQNILEIQYVDVNPVKMCVWKTMFEKELNFDRTSPLSTGSVRFGEHGWEAGVKFYAKLSQLLIYTGHVLVFDS